MVCLHARASVCNAQIHIYAHVDMLTSTFWLPVPCLTVQFQFVRCDVSRCNARPRENMVGGNMVLA